MRGYILKHSDWYKKHGPGEVVAAAAALHMVGTNCHYHLEYPNGGVDPLAPYPWDAQTKQCDCIGFAAWCAGFDRFQPKKFPYWDGYINTDSMSYEAMHAGKWFTVLGEPSVGDFIVSESYRTKVLRRRIVGHIGVMVDASEWKTKGLDGIQVVHCSSSNANRPGNKNHSAIWKTSGAVWKNYPKTRFVRFNREYALTVYPEIAVPK